MMQIIIDLVNWCNKMLMLTTWLMCNEHLPEQVVALAASLLCLPSRANVTRGIVFMSCYNMHYYLDLMQIHT